jgi:hypothetical protein
MSALPGTRIQIIVHVGTLEVGMRHFLLQSPRQSLQPLLTVLSFRPGPQYFPGNIPSFIRLRRRTECTLMVLTGDENTRS